MGQELLQEAVSAILDNFRKTLQRQEQSAKREKEGGAKKIKWPPRKALLARQTAALKRSEKERFESANYRPRLVFDGSDSYSSTSKLSQLQRVGCSDLKEAPKRYQGSYLLCRIVTPLHLYAGVSFIVDDPSGAAVPVAISHFTSNLNMTNEEASQILPIGTILAIREPFISLDYLSRAGPCSGKAEQGVRVDNPTDIIILDEDDHSEVHWTEEVKYLTSTVVDWLRPHKLIREKFDVEIDRLIAEGRPGEAYRVICRAKKEGIEVNKRIEGIVLFHLDAWQAAMDVFRQDERQENGFDAQLDKKAAADFAIPIARLSSRQASLRCRLRLLQARQGLSTSDMNTIYFAATREVSRLDTSDYIGPVAVRDIPGAGRGLVTTRAVEPGEMLLCCKAVCPAYPFDKECEGSPLLRLNLDNGVVSTTSQVRAQTMLIHAIVDRPELALPILGLTAGPSKPNSEYVDQEYPLHKTPNLTPDLCLHQRLDVDAAYVDGVLRFNAFGPAQAPSRDQIIASGSGELERATMPHPLPAILNHACLPNVSSVFFSNVVTTRALTHLPQGTEIVHQYVKGEEPLAIRSANLSKHGFECGCRLCVMDRADGADYCQVRARITQGESRAVLDRSALLLRNVSMEQIANGDVEMESEEAYEDIIEALQGLIDRIDATYSRQREVFRPDLFIPMDARTRQVARKSIKDALSSAKEAFACVGAVLDIDDEEKVLQELPKLHFDPTIALILFIAALLAHSKAISQSKAWVRSAFWAHECMTGGGIDVFLDRWENEDYKIALDVWRNTL